jgi:peptidoglycan hydrolase CwlO-like protein
MRKLLLILPMLTAVVWFSSCDNTAERERLEHERADSIRMADSVERINAEAMRTRDEYRTKTQREIDSLQMQINEMDAKMDKKGDKAKAEWKETKVDLNRRMERLKQRMSTAGDRTEANFNDFKTDVDTALDNIRKGWNGAMEKLKMDKK